MEKTDIIELVDNDDDNEPNQKKSKSVYPIRNSFERAVSFSDKSTKGKEISNALLYMIVVDDMPLCTPEKRGFLKFCKTLQPMYKVPTEKTMTSKIETKYSAIRLKVKNELSQAKSVCLTSDIWTNSSTMQSYVGLTIHFVKENDMVCVELGAFPADFKKDIANSVAAPSQENVSPTKPKMYPIFFFYVSISYFVRKPNILKEKT
ncbi:PREDICTED: zinc finger BED domain-containing protein 1-like isoform X3 [Rhagoletis zephyria]|nr:PREDICTED: zinc finger BED domain-containing protein 1-like isoform X3 [Rhagoletis zephyria]